MKTLRIIAQVIISCSLAIGLATPALAGGNVTIASGGKLSLNNSSKIKCSGDWTNEGTFDCGDSSTVTFNGSGTQDVTTGNTSGVTDWDNLVVTNGSGSAVTFKDKFTTNTFTCETGDAHLYFVHFDADSGPQKTFLIENDGGLTLTGTSGHEIVLDRSDGTGSDQWEICPTGGNPSVSYVNVSNSVNSASAYINPSTSTDVVNNENWFSATLVNMVSFRAIGYLGNVELVWETASEINNAGFNLYRAEGGVGGYTRLNAQLIPGLNTSAVGQTYIYTDTAVTNGKTYFYILEDVETTGKITKHGPVIAHPGLDTDGDGMSNDWEYYYGLNPHDPSDANLDPDGDGLTNYEEFLAGTNPNVIDSEDVEGGQDGIKITYLESGDIELELNTSVFTETQKIVGDTTYYIITIPTYNHAQNDEIGKPLVPVKSILLGVDCKKDLIAELLESEKETYCDYLLYPVEKVVMITDPDSNTAQHLSYEFYKDENAYAQSAFYPGKLYDVDYSGYLRDNMVVKVEFFPVQFNPASGELEFYKKIKLKVTLPEAEEREVVLNEKILPFTGEENYKIYIEEDGIYKITGQDFQDIGIDLAQINTGSIALYNQDQQIPAVLVGLEDGIFNSEDYIKFYAQGVDTNYTQDNIYWLNFNSAFLGIFESSGFQAEAPVLNSFTKKVHFEENALYWIYQEAMGEDHWFYMFILRAPGVQNVNFEIDDVALVDAEATLKIALQGISYYNDENPPHHVYFHLNGNFIGEDSWEGNQQREIEFNFNSAFLNDGVNTLSIELPGDTGWSYEKVMLNWMEVIYNRGFAVADDSIAFSHTQEETATFELTGFSSEDITIFDITDPQSPIEISDYEVIDNADSDYEATDNAANEMGYTIAFKDSGLKDYIAISNANLKTPKKIVGDEASDLRSTQNRADYIIICAPEFYETIQSFADYRTQKGFEVSVVKLKDIYDEFNYGVCDPDTIRDFLKYTYYNWQKPAPTYVLLVGDASFDYRNYYGFGYLNYVPTHMLSSGNFHETGSDNWFVCFDGEGDIAPEMLIGRFPVKTNEQLQSIINKIRDYEALDVDAEWAKKVLLIADDNENSFTDISDNLGSYLTDSYSYEKLYLSGFAESTADFKDNLINKINEGSLILNYAGHGATQLWADESIMTNSDLTLLYNAYQLPLVNMYTCLAGYFVYPNYYECLAEEFLTKDGGGAIAVIASGGLTVPNAQGYLAEGIFREFFLNGDNVVGSIFTQAKLYLLENVSSKDAINVIETFNLFGDPALSLKKQVEEEETEEEETEETEESTSTAPGAEETEEAPSEQTTEAEETEEAEETAAETETEQAEETEETEIAVTEEAEETTESGQTEESTPNTSVATETEAESSSGAETGQTEEIEGAETSTSSSEEINQITPPVYAVSSKASSSGLVKLTQLSSDAKRKTQEDIKAKSRGAKGATGKASSSQPTKTQSVEAGLHRAKGESQIQITKGTGDAKPKLNTLKPKPSMPQIKPLSVKNFTKGKSIKRLYKVAKQKHQQLTALVKNCKDAINSKDYKEARFRIRLISKVLKDKE